MKHSAALDLDWLSDRCDGDSSLVVEVLHHFSVQCKLHMDALRAAWNDGQMAKVAFHAEFLVGAAANVGASGMRLQSELLYNILSRSAADDQSLSIAKALNSVAASFQDCLTEVSASDFEMKETMESSKQASACKNRSCRLRLMRSEQMHLRNQRSEDRRRSSTKNRRCDLRIYPSSTNAASRESPVIARMRRYLDAMKAHNQAGRTLSARAEALALSFAASGAEFWGLAGAAARAGISGRYIAKQAVDELEMRLDTMAALWQPRDESSESQFSR